MSTSPTLPAVATIAQADDNMSNGDEYTFIFSGMNATTTALSSAINNYAPNFLTQVQVTIPQSSGSGSTYYVQTVYEGDGTDVISDVATSLSTSFSQAGISLSYQGTIDGPAPAALPGASTGPTYGSTTGFTDFVQNLFGTPVTQSQLAARQQQAAGQIAAVASSPGAQISPTVQASVASSATQQITASNADQSTIAAQANAAAPSIWTQLALVGAALLAVVLIARPKVTVGV